MKVLHLPIILCNQPSEITLALNRAGVKADYAVLDTNGQEWLLTHNNIKYNLHATDLIKNDPDMRLFRKALYKFFLHAAKEYDIFHFHSNISLFSQWLGHFKDLEILKKAGKKIVVSYWGCDIRTKSGNSKYKYNTCFACKAACEEEKKLFSRDTFAKYADLVIAHMPELYEYAPPGSVRLPSFIDTDYWESSHCDRPKSNVFKIFHPFGNNAVRGDVRGTEMIENAVDQLNKEGFNIEFLFFDKVPHSRMREYYEKADLVIEQLMYGTYGLTAIEAMALEIPVMGYIRDKYKKYYSDKIPIIDANPETITDVLRRTIQNKNDLAEIGKRGREFVVKYHDSKKIANRLISHYGKILKDKDKKIVNFENISMETRKAIGFKALVISGNVGTEDKEIKVIEQLTQKGISAILANYQLLKNPAKVKFHERNKSYEIFRFYGDQPSEWIKRFRYLGIMELYYSIRYFVLMNYRLLKFGLNIRPDIIHACNPEALIAGLLIKSKVGSSLIYEKDKNQSSDIKLPGFVKFLFYCVEKIFSKSIDALVLSDKTSRKEKNAKKIVQIYHSVLVK